MRIALATLVVSAVTATTVLAATSAQLSPSDTASLRGSRPNLVLIIADDVSATDLGCYGNAAVRTPNLDKLATHGRLWTRAYLTASVCSPSRCSIISGRYPHNTGAPELHTGLPEGQPLFPLELKKAGYWCAQAGKVCRELASAIDIAPTFLELAGVKIPPSVQGRSLLPQLADPAARICDYVFAERNWQVEYCHERTLRHGPWAYYRNGAPELAHFGFVNATYQKYCFPAYVDIWKRFKAGEALTPIQQTVFLKPRPVEQLFHLGNDPQEIRDLAGDPRHTETPERLRAVMDDWIAGTGDSIPPRERRTPDRHDRLTGKRRLPGGHPGPDKYEKPGQSAGAEMINDPGPR